VRTGTPDFLYSMGDQPTDLWGMLGARVDLGQRPGWPWPMAPTNRSETELRQDCDQLRWGSKRVLLAIRGGYRQVATIR
jgi:hypothetical protein